MTPPARMRLALREWEDYYDYHRPHGALDKKPSSGHGRKAYTAPPASAEEGKWLRDRVTFRGEGRSSF